MIPLVRYRLLSLKKCNVKYKLYIYISRNLERQNVENTKITIKIKIKNKQTKKKSRGERACPGCVVKNKYILDLQ